MTDLALLERLSPMGADAKSLRREPKRCYVADVKTEAGLESPPKKHMREKSKGASRGSRSGAAAGATKKKAARQSHEVAELQSVVEGIQQQVDAASKGIQELKQLVNTHLLGHGASTGGDHGAEPSLDVFVCVSPPASLMALDQDDTENELSEFPSYPPDAVAFYGGDALPFSC